MTLSIGALEYLQTTRRHSGASPTDPRKARSDGGEPGIQRSAKPLDSGSARKRAHPGMTSGNQKRRTVITLSHSNQPAGLQLFAAVAVEHFPDRCVVVLDLFS
jgi:hypothetical protein